MPSSDNPGWYERAEFICSDRTDAFFKWLDLDEYKANTGSVEAPVGWVGLVCVTSDMIRTWVSSQGDPWMSERRNFDSGWYIVRQDDRGFLWAMSYGGGCDIPGHEGELCADTRNEEAARADFAEAEAVYAAWDCENEH